VIAEALVAGVAERVPVLVAPTIDYVYAPVVAGRGGTLTLSADGFIELVSDVVRSLARHGAEHVMLVDRGEGTLAALNIVSRELHGELGITVAVASPAGLAWEQRQALIESDPDGHAGEEETSLMLALAPKRVRVERTPGAPPSLPLAARLPAGALFTPASLMDGPGYVGDPSFATAEKGRIIVEAMVEELVEHIREWREGRTG
jgi:creatinine amidohydrolase